MRHHRAWDLPCHLGAGRHALAFLLPPLARRNLCLAQCAAHNNELCYRACQKTAIGRFGRSSSNFVGS